MDYQESVAYLESLEVFGQQLGLERIKRLLQKLGNPQNQLKTIHAAGTNGKGSVCAMIASILQEAGYKVGLYTSPHLVDIKERFLINGKKITEEDVARLATLIRPLADQVALESAQPTYFEVTTAIAFHYFQEQAVDYAIIEVGLGGRLDATNAIPKPLVSVITSIDLEHTDILGDTIHEIAFEKAGIIKEGVPVVAHASDDAYRIIKRIADSEKSKIKRVAKKYSGKIGLQGEFQKMNAAVAVEAIKAAKIPVAGTAIKAGIEKVIWPGRIDLRNYNRKRILFDCSHNLSGIKVLIPELKHFERERLIVLTSILKDKDYKHMLELIGQNAQLTILTKSTNPRACEPEVLAKYTIGPRIAISDLENAIDFVLNEAGTVDLILVTGSIYLVGDVMQVLRIKTF